MWSCNRCTYSHSFASQRCSMCGALRVSKEQMRDFVTKGKRPGETSPPKRARMADASELGAGPSAASGLAGWGGGGRPAPAPQQKATESAIQVEDNAVNTSAEGEIEAVEEGTTNSTAKEVDGIKLERAKEAVGNGDSPRDKVTPTAEPSPAKTAREDNRDNAQEDSSGVTEEPMKDGAFDLGESTAEIPATTTEPLHMSVALEYEPTSDESAGKSQILTIAYRGNGANVGSHSSTVVGTISGRARLEVLPLLSADDTRKEAGGESLRSLSVDVFGYRIRRPPNNDNGGSSNGAIVINRPDWMNALPISVVCQHGKKVKGGSPTVLQVRVQSLPNERSGATNDGGRYYSAYPQETYQLNVLPPSELRPGNYTAAGSGVCTILERWKDTLDQITGGIICPRGEEDSAGSSQSGNRLLLCGAKGVGKSTLLRYAANRILSSQSRTSEGRSEGRQGGRVAILDLDCGQPEMSPPGMLTLNVVSRPLLSDPPVHMVCGGSCDHYGQKMGSGSDGHAQSDSAPAKHVAAYFFGDVTSKSDPDTYIQMVTQLMRRYDELATQEGNGNLPLLVNTDGWVKGLGYEILSAIVGTTDPGHIIQIMGSTRVKSFDMSSHGMSPISANDARPRSIHVFPSFDESALPVLDDDNQSRRSIDSSSSTGPLLASASDHRSHRLCTYFLGGHDQMTKLRSHIPGECEPISFHKERGLYDPNNIIGVTLASLRPYAVPFHHVKLYPQSGLMDGAGELRSQWGVQGDAACSDVLDCLNGSVVGLCCRPDELDKPLSGCNAGTGVPVLTCLGLGILRSIDHMRRVFFVLTPVHPELLQNVTSFVGGNIALPLECIYRGVHSDSFPFLSCGHGLTSAGLGGDAMKNRGHTASRKGN
ncbi:hypothetical protein ACHAXT_012124 [Thalassiosira profunda]